MVNKNNVDYNHKVLEVENLKKHFYNGSGKNKFTVPAVDGVTFDVYDVNPPTNQYFNYSQYYLPKKQF